ncbi:hypothetical protein swp_3745 [Shewanella piezotolerans WP3]|uniref:Uncharacterized protein n=1 Tax=Shewanella piezotolerans (strain WP3 / JCM 13877) TaxID=225849 RepID=B8CSD7_SHEPW|nr:hypothetical protein swp_3745 [Shewanella piezotolerans WP3]
MVALWRFPVFVLLGSLRLNRNENEPRSFIIDLRQ